MVCRRTEQMTSIGYVKTGQRANGLLRKYQVRNLRTTHVEQHVYSLPYVSRILDDIS
jgi:hypothetical protein